MKLYRPYIPLSVRVQVAERQFYAECDQDEKVYYLSRRGIESLANLLEYLLVSLFGNEASQLDHDPALVLRRKRTMRSGEIVYSPDANDPNHLIYREKADHQQKTTGRKPGAERTVTTLGSDIGLKTKFARLEKKANASATMRMSAQRKRKEKRKLQSRQFPKGKWRNQ